MAQPRNVLILGAAGRDFHNFNVFFRDRPEYRVVGFTAALTVSVRKLNATAPIVPMGFLPTLDRPELVRDRNVLVIEDGPSVTHGEMRDGAGTVAAREGGGKPVDPRRAHRMRIQAG